MRHLLSPAAVLRALPEGGKLPLGVWAARHRWIVRLLWFHAAGLAVMALLQHNSVLHSLTETLPLAGAAVIAGSRRLPRGWRSATATAGLVSASAILVHLSGGLVEMHFHFFVVIAVVALYQDRVPFLVALGFVVIHHAAAGAIDPTSVFNHPAALAAPAKWAALHGLFVLGASAAAVTNWKLNEITLNARRRSEEDLAEAQRLARLGSWTWHIAFDSVTWSQELYRIFGLEPGDLEPTYAGYMERVHPADVEATARAVEDLLASGTAAEFQHRILRPDGEIRWLDVWARVVADDDGHPVKVTGSAQDVTDRRRAEDALAHQALHDSLTGLANRVLFQDRLEHALARQRRQASLSAVLFLDLDDFKHVNDGLGHNHGDRLLQAVGGCLSSCLRPEDTAARLGGDEFAVLLEGLHHPDEATAVATRILETLGRPFSLDSSLLIVSASIGIAVADPGSDPEQLLRQADVAMYQAKAAGKNGVCLFEAGMHDDVMQRLELQADLQRAVERDEIVNHYQPVVDLDSGAVIGVEALVRWEHPARGTLAPAAFMQLAEDTGLIVPIGRQVLRQACDDVRAWQAVYPSLSLNVNLSPRQLQDPHLASEVAACLAASGLEAGSLTLEITETVLLSDDAAAARTLGVLKALGVSIALDDFGTGYSSLSHLERFPVDVVKIDRRFVQQLGAGDHSASLTRAILGLGATLGLQVVAEGIEEPEQRQALLDLGCQLGQGFLFARPLPAEAVCGALSASLELTGQPG